MTILRLIDGCFNHPTISRGRGCYASPALSSVLARHAHRVPAGACRGGRRRSGARVAQNSMHHPGSRARGASGAPPRARTPRCARRRPPRGGAGASRTPRRRGRPRRARRTVPARPRRAPSASRAPRASASAAARSTRASPAITTSATSARASRRDRGADALVTTSGRRGGVGEERMPRLERQPRGHHREPRLRSGPRAVRHAASASATPPAVALGGDRARADEHHVGVRAEHRHRALVLVVAEPPLRPRSVAAPSRLRSC